MTSNPDDERDQAEHGEHHGEGDGGVGGDCVEKEVDYCRHGAGNAPAGMMVQYIYGMEDRFRNRGVKQMEKERQGSVSGL